MSGLIAASATAKEAELGVLGALLMSPAVVLDALAGEEGLRADHFQYDMTRRIFRAIADAAAEGVDPDEITVAARLPADRRADVQICLAAAAPFASTRGYARAVIHFAERQLWRQAGLLLIDAADADDEGLRQRAGTLLDTGTAEPSNVTTPDELGMLVWQHVDGQQPPDLLPLPWGKLEHWIGGGLVPGDTTVIAGWTSHGKSVVCDQLVTHAARDRGRGAIYINEMGRLERALREVARLSGVPFLRLRSRTLQPDDHKPVVDAAGRIGFHVVDAAGWTAQRIARHMRVSRWTIAAVDHVHLVPGASEVRELDAISTELNAAARQANTHLLIVAQLNDERAKQENLPRPVLRDIRGSARLRHDAANVLFVYLPAGDPAADPHGPRPADLYWAKVRNGALGGAATTYDPVRLRFLETADA